MHAAALDIIRINGVGLGPLRGIPLLDHQDNLRLIWGFRL